MPRTPSRLLPILAALAIVAASGAATALPVLGGKAQSQAATPAIATEPAPKDASLPAPVPGPMKGHRGFAAWDSWQLVVVEG